MSGFYMIFDCERKYERVCDGPVHVNMALFSRKSSTTLIINISPSVGILQL